MWTRPIARGVCDRQQGATPSGQLLDANRRNQREATVEGLVLLLGSPPTGTRDATAATVGGDDQGRASFAAPPRRPSSFRRLSPCLHLPHGLPSACRMHRSSNSPARHWKAEARSPWPAEATALHAITYAAKNQLRTPTATPRSASRRAHYHNLARRSHVTSQVVRAPGLRGLRGASVMGESEWPSKRSAIGSWPSAAAAPSPETPDSDPLDQAAEAPPSADGRPSRASPRRSGAILQRAQSLGLALAATGHHIGKPLARPVRAGSSGAILQRAHASASLWPPPRLAKPARQQPTRQQPTRQQPITAAHSAGPPGRRLLLFRQS